MNRLVKTLILSLLPVCTVQSFAQDNFDSFSRYLSPEKLYVQTDRDVYCVGDTLWFKAYLRNASELSCFPECNYIYAEILSTLVETDANLGKDIAKESVRIRVKVKRDRDGVLCGYVPIPENLNSGIAVFRAYSYWMMNKEAQYMFSKNIEVRNPLKDDYYNTIKEADFRESEKYTALGMENPFDKHPGKKTAPIDIQFLPESGRYLAGEPSVFGIKAVSENGRGVAVKGVILIDGRETTSFETNQLGFAKLQLAVPMDSKSIEARINDCGKERIVRFPSAEGHAVTIACKIDSLKVSSRISVRGIAPEGGLTAIAYDKSEIYFRQEVKTARLNIELPCSELKAGINNIAVIDNAGNVYSERSFFVCPRVMAKASISSDRQEYRSDEKATCRFSLSDDSGAPISGDFSLAVTDEAYSPFEGNGYNAVSYFYLGSELPSFVEDSWRYFNPERPLEQRISDADLLMLTQGWKYYDLEQILTGRVPLPLCGKEFTQSLSGRIQRPLGKRNRKVNVSFLAQSIGYSSIHQLDSLGAFSLNKLDFPEGTRFLVSAEGLGGNRFFNVILDNDVFAKEHSYYKYKRYSGYDINYKVKAMPLYYNADGTPSMTLNPTFVVANRRSAQKNLSPFPEYEFKPGQYRTPEQLQPYNTYDIPSYVTMTFPSVRIDTTSAGEYALLCRTNKISTRMTINSGWEPVIIYVNRMPSSYEDILSYTIEDLEGLAYISGTDAARFNILQDATSPRSVLMLKTKNISKTPVNLTSLRPLGWQRPARTYRALYNVADQGNKIRPTLLWQPKLSLDDEGNADFEFYNSNSYAGSTIIVEGLTAEGIPIFCIKQLEKD